MANHITIDVNSLKLSEGSSVTETYKVSVDYIDASIDLINMKGLAQYKIEFIIPEMERKNVFIASVSYCTLCDGKDYSEETAKKIDEEIRNLVSEAYTRAKDLLTKNRGKLDKLAKALVEKEVLDIDESRVLLDMAAEPKPQSQEKSASDKTDSVTEKT